jgi:hypothetical protein
MRLLNSEAPDDFICEGAKTVREWLVEDVDGLSTLTVTKTRCMLFLDAYRMAKNHEYWTEDPLRHEPYVYEERDYTGSGDLVKTVFFFKFDNINGTTIRVEDQEEIRSVL